MNVNQTDRSDQKLRSALYVFVQNIAKQNDYEILPYNSERRQEFARFQVLQDKTCVTRDRIKTFMDILRKEVCAYLPRNVVHIHLTEKANVPYAPDDEITDTSTYFIEMQVY